MRRPRRSHTSAFKAMVATAAFKGDKTLVALAKKFEVHLNQFTQWKAHLLASGNAIVFATLRISDVSDTKSGTTVLGRLKLMASI